jgi:HSP20 family protein
MARDRDEVRFPHVLFLQAASQVPREEAWQPRADVYRMPGGWLVKLELAGVRPEDVRLEARGSVLRVQGTRRDAGPCAGLCCHQLEIAYSRFERVVELPELSESVELVTTYHDGMLMVRIVTEGRK